MASIESGGGGGGGGEEELENAHVVELVASTADSDSLSEDQITPLLPQSEKPKISIFSVSHPRRKPNKDQLVKATETEISPFTQFILWAWSGSRYSGLLCMALSSCIYCMMEILTDVFSAQSIPLFEIAFTRCSIMSILSLMWLRRSGQPIFGPANVRNTVFSRAVTGCISLLTFIYCIQRLPLSQAIILSFTTPVMSSFAAKFILHEKLKIAEIAGIAFSFFGVLFIFRSMMSTKGGFAKGEETKDSNIHGSYHVYAVLIGLLSSLTGGASYCFVRAGAKASDQPLVTIFSFGILSTPVTAICTFILEDFVLPNLYSFILMIILGVLAFFAELFLSRGFQLEKTSKVSNILYLEVALSQFWRMCSSRVVPSFGSLLGCFIIFVSASCTMYIGPEKEME